MSGMQETLHNLWC